MRRRTLLVGGIVAIGGGAATMLFLDDGAVALDDGEIESVDTDGDTVIIRLVDDHNVLGVGISKPNQGEMNPSSTEDVGSGQTEITMDAEFYRDTERNDGWKVVAYGEGYGDFTKDAEVLEVKEFSFDSGGK